MIRGILSLRRTLSISQRRTFAICLKESERALRESVEAYSRSTILPKVAHMDEVGKMDPDLVKSLFEQV
jgi:hypothetical protein